MFLIFVAALLLVSSCREDTGPPIPNGSIVKTNAKVSGDLLALREQYAASGQAGMSAFVAAKPGLRLIGGERVVIDAVAAEDAAALGRDLQAIGASDVSVSGRTVSAQLPIEAIDELQALPSLKFARPSYGEVR